MLQRRVVLAVPAALMAALLLAGCHGSGEGTGKGASALAGSAKAVVRDSGPPAALSSDAGEPARQVLVSGMRFEPETVTVRPGETVLWHFNDPGIVHSVTAFDGAFDSGLKAAGSSFSVRFDTPGAYCYQCIPHPGSNLCARGAAPDGGPLRLSGVPLWTLLDAVARAAGGGMRGRVIVRE